MKRMFWIIPGLVVAIGLLLAGYHHLGNQAPSEVMEGDGGVQHDTSYDAPKTIESTQIISFRCDFSGFPLSKEDIRLAGRAYQPKRVMWISSMRRATSAASPSRALRTK